MVAEYSRAAAGEYTAANDLDIVEAPQWLVERLTKRTEKPIAWPDSFAPITSLLWKPSSFVWLASK